MTEAALDFSEDEISLMLANLDQYTPDEVTEIDRLVDELSNRKYKVKVVDDLIAFCKHMQPDYKVGKHHRMLANLLMDIEQGQKDRICVNIPLDMANPSWCPLCSLRGSLVGILTKK